MGQAVDVRILGDTGELLWQGAEAGYKEALASVDPGNSALRMLADGDPEHRCARDEVMRTAEALQLVSRRGVPRGFLTTLPRGALFEAGVDAFNAPHLAALDVHPVHFPLVFDGSGPAMTELTADYAAQQRMFELTEKGGGLRLSYAADPNLFSWLQDTTLDRARLPYAMYSPQPVFRRFRSGETNIQRRRQFTVPDVHVLAAPENAGEQYLHALGLAAESTAFWFGRDYVHVLDSVVGTTQDTDDFYRQAAKHAGGITVVRRLPAHPKYYAQKTAILVSSGYDAVMLQNIQLDEINAPRFGIRLDDGTFPVIIHACVAMGGSRMLPLVLGRGLAGLGPKEIPAELAAVQVAFVPLAEKHVGRAYELAGSLWTRDVRTAVDLEFRRPVRARIARLRRDWQPLYCVIGDRELTEAPGLQTSGGQRIDEPYEQYLGERLPRWLRCLAHTPAGTAAQSPVLAS
ncbi:His/Gly/Thr/Pro-type tRNA ligase C-terminal domain-containing protein [Streptomyces barringtoniae]|uniref:His/Gly/Thr/Pro-type tRNA ligase C-terminal domain-containing protein n=1 Tax=Streptomyces barringtoniae TaxID=2892029 RepID=UPI001E412350|nr:His/Gly/Thr/Pro-type tRNA ligase C-terminal domain-containing protein [Streptomyces barringtoniae]MCC5480847.1 hypothetical protein [Streptomyces barringtoniae]